MIKNIITSTNSKLGFAIPQINMPAVATCRHDAPCKKTCYASKGKYKYNNVKNGIAERYNIYKQDPKKFFNQIINELNGLTVYKYVRWHATGDIIDINYLYGIVKVAKAVKNTRFLCFTKRFDLVNLYLSLGHKLPNNLKIVFSAWDKDFKVENPYNLPVAYVNFKNKELNPDIPQLAIPCAGRCDKCLACWGLKKGQAVYFDQH